MSLPKSVILYCAGSFNPITNKHLRLLELARDALHKTGQYKVVKGILVPANAKYAKDNLVAAHHRLAMVKLAVDSNAWLCTDSWEVEQSQWPPTAVALDALKDRIQDGTVSQCIYNGSAAVESDSSTQLKRKRPNDTNSHESSEETDVFARHKSAKIMLVCGSDLLRSFSVPDLWAKEHMEQILRDHGLVVVVREGSDPYQDIYSSDMISKYSHNIHIVTDWLGDDFSSTKIRTAIRRNESIKYAVPEPVLEYILKHKLYNPNYRPGFPYPSSEW
ncbi:NMNAT1 [Bugula neritina]|uniref:Nicotinamide-nucleotide adenylyltransferase n=1 Tax=Bugula neritina TaxID=10212 RepID=A0A7J7KJB7_BUGNE|nr:NMNAT1 [Bugula neritina]